MTLFLSITAFYVLFKFIAALLFFSNIETFRSASVCYIHLRPSAKGLFDIPLFS